MERGAGLRNQRLWVRIPPSVPHFNESRGYGAVVQREETTGLNPVQCGFESHLRYHKANYPNLAEGAVSKTVKSGFESQVRYIYLRPYGQVERR